ncbi:hypothetical protein J132_09206 [Termitomyces sp. J132]|nr:hypothetical protein J132_09206 [Termitomyces sp. J132]
MQLLASLKVSCSLAEAANALLREHVYIAGHLIVIHKDIREPIQCNKCHVYGHIRAKCTNTSKCSHCASESHSSLECPIGATTQCTSCGLGSNHGSALRKCPIFIKHCHDLDTKYPENSMPYFSTGDPSTWVLNLKKLSVLAPITTPWIEQSAPTAQTLGPCQQTSLMDFLKMGPSGSPPPSSS